MNLLHLIKCAALHICRYRRLLIWNLFAYCLYTSCSAQVKHGVRDIKAPIRGGIESQLAPSRGHDKFNELKKNHDYFYAHTAPAPNKDKKNWLLPLISSIKSWYTKSTKHTDLFIAIENYCQLNPDPKHQDRAEVKINKILEKIKHRKIRYSSKRAITDENPLHLIVASHSMNGLSEGQRKFLEEVARTLVKDHAWLANDLNHIEKTPLHSAIRNGNVEMAQILLRSTDLGTKGEVPIFLNFALKLYSKGNFDTKTERNIEQIINLLFDRHLYKGYFDTLNGINTHYLDEIICFIATLSGWDKNKSNDENKKNNSLSKAKNKFLKELTYKIADLYNERLI